MTMTTRRFGFVLLPDFALLPLSCMVDTLADANYVSERPLYEWYSLSIEGTEVMAANGLRLATDYEIADAPPLFSVVVCSAFDAHLHRSRRMSRWLNRLVESGARVGAIATGPWQLAYAGLLDGRRCTIHWEDLPSFREAFPALRVSDAIFEIDGPVFTCWRWVITDAWPAGNTDPVTFHLASDGLRLHEGDSAGIALVREDWQEHSFAAMR